MTQPTRPGGQVGWGQPNANTVPRAPIPQVPQTITPSNPYVSKPPQLAGRGQPTNDGQQTGWGTNKAVPRPQAPNPNPSPSVAGRSQYIPPASAQNPQPRQGGQAGWGSNTVVPRR